MTKRVARWGVGVALAIAVSAAVVVSKNSVDEYGSGKIIDLMTKAGIAGVDVQLECIRNKFLEGTEVAKTMHATSAEDGRYVVASSWMKGCAYIGATVTKAGYENAGLLEHSGVPAAMGFNPAHAPDAWMVRHKDVHRLQLQRLFDDSSGVRKWPKGPLPLQDYILVNAPFFKSFRIASEPEDRRWLQEHYCDRLSHLWDALGVDDRAALAKYPDIVDHEQVLQFCGAGK